MLIIKNLLFISLFVLCITVHADMNIIKDGNIVAQKLYSKDESTLIISKAERIYVCSVDGNISECILSSINNN